MNNTEKVIMSLGDGRGRSSAVVERAVARMNRMKRCPTVQDVINSHSGVAPGFSFLRHALAVVIILYHTYNVTFGRDVNPGYVKGELIANWSELSTTQFAIEVLRPGLFSLVGAFFALSGFL